jgi:hypothetical protein
MSKSKSVRLPIPRTQKQLIRINQELERLRKREEVLTRAQEALYPVCTHQHLDGSDAIEQGYFNSTCSICDYDDMGY